MGRGGREGGGGGQSCLAGQHSTLDTRRETRRDAPRNGLEAAASARRLNRLHRRRPRPRRRPATLGAPVASQSRCGRSPAPPSATTRSVFGSPQAGRVYRFLEIVSHRRTFTSPPSFIQLHASELGVKEDVVIDSKLLHCFFPPISSLDHLDTCQGSLFHT